MTEQVLVNGSGGNGFGGPGFGRLLVLVRSAGIKLLEPGLESHRKAIANISRPTLLICSHRSGPRRPLTLLHPQSKPARLGFVDIG